MNADAITNPHENTDHYCSMPAGAISLSENGPVCVLRTPARLLACIGLALLLVLGVGSQGGGLAEFETSVGRWDDTDGRAPHAEELRPSVEAAFQSESYAPRSIARLKFFNTAPQVRIRLFRVGPEHVPTVGYSEMRGVPVSLRTPIGTTSAGRIVRVRIGSWPSGVYFARLVAADGRVGFAPFIVRPRRLGEHSVAVVMPTQTWQAYNIRDDDGDGAGDSWYATWKCTMARLYRPFLNRGVPPNFRMYDLRFLHWLAWSGRRVDFLSDGDLDRVSNGTPLGANYRLIVFPGHHEYVTTREYNAITQFRDQGGSLIFLSANNFSWKIVRHGGVMERTTRWRDIGRPEAALIGVQYTTNMRRFGRYEVLDTRPEPWLFAGTGLHRGSVFGNGGIEIDAISSSSPRNVRVVARIPNVFGRGLNADMTIYRTSHGGLVFAAGSFTLADQALYPYGSRIIGNLWREMTHEG